MFCLSPNYKNRFLYEYAGNGTKILIVIPTDIIYIRGYLKKTSLKYITSKISYAVEFI